LAKNQKRKWPNLPMSLSVYNLLNEKHSQKKVDLLDGIWLAQGYFKRHDPIEVVKRHCVVVKRKTYIHEDNYFNLVFDRATSFHELSDKIDVIRNISNLLNFVERQVKRKIYFLKEKNKK
jgi:hypothetical protein